MIDRRTFVATSGLLAASALTGPARAAGRAWLRVAVISDTHLTDRFYHGNEGPDPLDVASIGQVHDRALAARAAINVLRPRVDLVLVAGDLFHNYPSADEAFYATNRTRLDEARALFDGFDAPVHLALGNHDYGVPEISREMTHRLVATHLRTQPWHAVDMAGIRFLMINCMEGFTWDAAHPRYNRGIGSFGELQLRWLDAQLAEARHAFIVMHYPIPFVLDLEEAPGLGFYGLLAKHRAKIARVFAGHWHRWIDFGDTFGVPHTLVASTRYDGGNYLIVDVDPATGAHRLVNAASLGWGTRFAKAI